MESWSHLALSGGDLKAGLNGAACVSNSIAKGSLLVFVFFKLQHLPVTGLVYRCCAFSRAWYQAMVGDNKRKLGFASGLNHCPKPTDSKTKCWDVFEANAAKFVSLPFWNVFWISSSNLHESCIAARFPLTCTLRLRGWCLAADLDRLCFESLSLTLPVRETHCLELLHLALLGFARPLHWPLSVAM